MQKLWSLFLALVVSAGAASSLAQSSSSDALKIGEVVTVASNAISIRVSGTTTELNQLALQAFNSHGRYSVNQLSSPKYDIRFSPAGGNQVNVQIMQGTAVVFNQTANGTSMRNALLRAADLAVTATSKLPGYFASKLAFVSNRTGKDEIYVGDLFLGEVRQVTRDNAFALTPRWSPDGRRLLYTSYFKGFPDIYQIDIGSMQRTNFVSVQGTNSGARFSPNGQQVVMALSGLGRPEIFVSNAAGRDISRRTNSEAVKSSPCFSPDGSQIVYASEPGPQLYTIPNVKGQPTPRRLTSGLSRYCAEPDWSRADPSKIAFTFSEGRTFQIAVLDLKTGKSEKVSKKIPLDAVEPSWLADGRHLVYTARAAGSRGLFILDTETGRSTRISSVSAEKASVWGP